ncbi:uncharacterized protein FA14DRAFT_63108 [Meira miltonrushii]|uniref:Protein Zds1 C-terminal domain-containing protein n=1 Tax=Meira miltonrushii TaxID=1280837 RepID=A0A316V7N6_9BASI|nr:uncharacterized protein FA14DRAFT_63108 [Meira miltonrushii]PWN33526.1 hypothetical protein FA14DRAFT_63108 [Meira miltonrushii]
MMQKITDSEFQREVEALKSHRRISVNRPIHDPDLPELTAANRSTHDSDYSLHSANSSGSLHSSSNSRDWTSDGGVMLRDDGPSSLTGSLARRSSSNPRSLFTARRRGAAAEEGQVPTRDNQSNVNASTDDVPLTEPLDPSHLFWVPASMHPEISPSDFRRFLHDHASRAVREQQEGGKLSVDEQSNLSKDQQTPYPSSLPSNASPVSSVEALKKRSTSIARRGSTLRRQYRPEMDDGIDSSSTSNVERNKRTLSQRQSYQSNVPELSIDDLQKLERLAEEASRSSDPSELRSVLRRTMSLNVAPSALDQVDAVPPENEQDSPLIVPRPGQILRRAARTKIRKSSFSNEGANAGSRRRRGPGSQSVQEPLSDREGSTNTAGVTEEGSKRESDISEPSDESANPSFKARSEGVTDSILDVYSRDSFLSDDTQRTSVTSLAESIGSGQSSNERLAISDANDDPTTPTQSHMTDGFVQAQTETFNNGYFGNDQGQRPALSREPSNETSTNDRSAIKPIAVQHVSPVPAFEKTRSAPLPPSTSSLQQQKAKDQIIESNQAQSGTPASYQQPPLNQKLVKSDTMPILGSMQSAPPIGKPTKEKKSSFGLHWLSNWTKDDDGEKMSKKEKKERKERGREREAQENATMTHPSQQTSNHHEKDGSTSSSFLGNLFGKKKGHEDSSKNEYGSHMYNAASGMHNPSTGSLLDMYGKPMMEQGYYTRYPIHIERAVYRLSHIKLANPRRPLYEQVLISNLMFWYLSVINRTQQQQQQLQQQQQQQTLSRAEQQGPEDDMSQRANTGGGDLYSTPEENESRLPEAESRLELDNNTSHITVGDQIQPDHLKREAKDSPAISLPLDLSTLNLDDAEGRQNSTARTNSIVKELFGSTKNSSSHQEDNGVYGGESDSYHSGNQSLPNSSSLNGNGKGGLISGKGRTSGQPNASVNTQKGSSIPNTNPNSKTKRGGLVKPNRAPPGTRSAERAIPAAAYGAQHRQISSEMLVASASNKDISSTGQSSSSNRYSSNERFDRQSPPSGPVRLGGGGRSVSSGHSSVRDNEYAWMGGSSGGGEAGMGNEMDSPGLNQEDRKSDPMSDHSQRQMHLSSESDSFGGGRKLGNRLSEPARGGDHGSYFDNNQQERDHLYSNRDQDLLLSNGVATGREASAMLDAARLSQSRRR